jgi:hypothetical protein
MSMRISKLIASPVSSIRIPSSDQLSSGSLSAALAWPTGSAAKKPPCGGD